MKVMFQVSLLLSKLPDYFIIKKSVVTEILLELNLFWSRNYSIRVSSVKFENFWWKFGKKKKNEDLSRISVHFFPFFSWQILFRNSGRRICRISEQFIANCSEILDKQFVQFFWTIDVLRISVQVLSIFSVVWIVQNFCTGQKIHRNSR